MFGLQNHRGSCWVNAAIQSIFRIPDIQQRYSSDEYEKGNAVDESLYKLWKSSGRDGLKDFFEAVRTDTMPAGIDIGDTHELIQYLCDKIPFLDKLCRFKIAHSMECVTCGKTSISHDSVIEFLLDSVIEQHAPISKCIEKTVTPYIVNEWKCESCNNTGGKRQQLIGSFPKCMMFHASIANTTVDYSSILILNKKRYALLSASFFNGGHWWVFGRNMPIGSSWYTLDDMNISKHGSKELIVSPHMRILIYYRLDE